MCFSKFKTLLATTMLCALTACAKHQIPPQSQGYNEGLAKYGSQQILLNIVRAAKRMPLYFTGIGNVTFSDAVNPQLGVRALPFITGQPVDVEISPSVNLTNGFSNFQATNLNTAKFSNSLLRRIDGATLQYFLDLRIPADRIFNLFVDSISLSKRKYELVRSQAAKVCDAKRKAGERERLCDNRDLEHELQRFNVKKSSIDRCVANEKKGKLYSGQSENERVISLQNGGRSACNRVKFQIFVRDLSILDFEILVDGVSAEFPGKANFALFNEKGNQIPLAIGNTNPREGIQLRSVESMIFYLGEVTAIKLFQDDEFYPRVGFEAKDELFDIELGPAKSSNDVAVQLNGQWFRVSGKRKPGPTDNTSFSIINLLTLLIDLQTTETQLLSNNQILQIVDADGN